MKLYSSLTSPYARKIRVLVRELGLVDEVEEVLADPFRPDEKLLAAVQDGSSKLDDHAKRSASYHAETTDGINELKAKIDELQATAQKIGEQVYKSSQDAAADDGAKDADFDEKKAEGDDAEKKDEKKDEEKK